MPPSLVELRCLEPLLPVRLLSTKVVPTPKGEIPPLHRPCAPDAVLMKKNPGGLAEDDASQPRSDGLQPNCLAPEFLILQRCYR